MTEIRTPHEQLAADLRYSIAPGMNYAESLVALPAVQKFCGIQITHAVTWGTDAPLELLTNPRKENIPLEEALETLADLNDYVDDFVACIVEKYCLRKKQRVPGYKDTAAHQAIMTRVLVQGAGKINELALEESTLHHLQERIDFANISPTLIYMAAKALESHNALMGLSERNAAIDATLKEGCETIAAGNKITVPKGMSQDHPMRLYAASLNCLKTFYEQPREKAFKGALKNYFLCHFLPEDDVLEDLSQANNAEKLRVQRKLYDDLTSFFNEHLGTNYEPLKDLGSLLKVFDDAVKFYDPIGQTEEAFQSSFVSLTGKLFSAHSARAYVNGIAHEGLTFSAVLQAMETLRVQPLAPEPKEVVSVPSEFINWELLPHDTREDSESWGGSIEELQSKFAHIKEVDWARLWRLQNYAGAWNKSYFVRSCIPNLSPDKQYYAIILPEKLPDGTVIEHAVADHPETGNGLYAWRAELAMENHEGRRLTWRDVLALPRRRAREYGARCFYHTDGLEGNLLDYLTAAPKSIIQRRHHVGKYALFASS